MPQRVPARRPSFLTHVSVAATGLAGALLLMGLWQAGQGSSDAEAGIPQAPVTGASAIRPAAAPLVHADFTHPERDLVRRSAILAPRETLAEMLDALGVPAREAYAAMQPVYERGWLDPRRLRPGLSASVTLEAGPEAGEDGEPALRLVGLSLRADKDRSLLITRTAAGGFEPVRLDVRLMPQTRRVTGTIETSLYDAALKGGAFDQQVVDFAQIFAYDIDFQREIHPGDAFEILHEVLVDERGRPVRTGEVLYAALDGKALSRGFYRFTPPDDGITDYFDDTGESATKFLMKTPINGARLSSRFGMRRHPISGYSRLHKGTDFAAPTGTPVFAAGNGVVERASRHGGYGNYVRIQHANGYETAYAHLSRYGPGIRSGRRVRQGEVIGYVGSTGASTGPHLHYEVLINGKHVNAMTLNLPTGRQLEGDTLKAFNAHRDHVDALRRGEATLAPVQMAGETDGGLLP